MSESEKPGLAEVLLAAALGTVAGALSYYLDKKDAEAENCSLDENLLPVYIGGGAIVGAIAGGISVASERSRQEQLQRWHVDHPRLSKTMAEIEKNPKGHVALKEYAKLTGLGN